METIGAGVLGLLIAGAASQFIEVFLGGKKLVEYSNLIEEEIKESELEEKAVERELRSLISGMAVAVPDNCRTRTFSSQCSCPDCHDVEIHYVLDRGIDKVNRKCQSCGFIWWQWKLGLEPRVEH